jgi:hypothetical protein
VLTLCFAAGFEFLPICCYATSSGRGEGRRVGDERVDVNCGLEVGALESESQSTRGPLDLHLLVVYAVAYCLTSSKS